MKKNKTGIAAALIIIALLSIGAVVDYLAPVVCWNMTSLRNLTPNESKPAFVLGYNTPGDGGDGWYTVTNTTSGTNAYGGRVLASGGAKSWQLLPVNNTITSAQFGINTGSSNLVQMQAWIDYTAANRLIAFANPGEYGLTNSLILPSWSHLEGVTASRFLTMGVSSQTNTQVYGTIRSVTAFQPFLTNGGFVGPIVATSSNITIKGFTVGTMPGWFSRFPVVMMGVENVRIEDITTEVATNHWAFTIFGNNVIARGLQIYNTGAVYQDGYHIVGGKRHVLANSVIQSGDDAIPLTIGSRQQTDIEDVSVVNCAVYSSHAHGIRIDNENLSGTNYIKNWTFNGIVGRASETKNALIRIDSQSTNLSYPIINGSLANIRIIPATTHAAVGADYGVHIHNADNIYLNDVHTGITPYWNYYIRDCGKITLDNCTGDGATESSLNATLFAQDVQTLNILGGFYTTTGLLDTDTISTRGVDTLNILGSSLVNTYTNRACLVFSTTPTLHVNVSDTLMSNNLGRAIIAGVNPTNIILMGNRVYYGAAAPILWQGSTPPTDTVIIGNSGLSSLGEQGATRYNLYKFTGEWLGSLDTKYDRNRFQNTNGMFVFAQDDINATTTKISRIGFQPYLETNLPMTLAVGTDTGSSSSIGFGGGSGLYANPQTMSFYSTFTYGVAGGERMRFNANGLIIAPGGVSAGVTGDSALELDSTTKGFRTPKMTTAQRLAITVSKAAGLQIFDTDFNMLFVTRGTGTNSWRATIPWIMPDQGDNSVTVSPWQSQFTFPFSTTLTANRTVTLATGGAITGDKITIVRNAATPGAFTLDVGGLKTIPINVAATVTVQYNGSAWVLVGYQLL